MGENWICPRCKAYNHPRRRGCWQCQRAEMQAAAARARGFKLIVGLGGTAVGIVLIVLCLAELAPLFTRAFTAAATPLLAPTPTFAPTSTPTMAPTPSPSSIVSLRELDSYRMEMRVSISNTLFSGMGWLITEEWNKGSQAFHMAMSMEIPESTPEPGVEASPEPGMADLFGMLRTEIIGIGDTYWVNQMGEWRQIQGAALQSSQEDMSAEVGYKYVQLLHNLVPVGEEVVNNVRCVRYFADEDLLQMSGGSQGNMTVHISGDIWVAYQPDLPPVVIKLRLMQTSRFDSPTPDPTQDPFQAMVGMLQTDEISNVYEYDVVGVNIPISITPPLTNTLSS